MKSARAVPKFNCIAGCTACCTVVPFSDKDKAALSAIKPFLAWERNTRGSGWIIKQAKETGRCPFLGGNGCSIHGTPVYPQICALFGAVDHPQMTCPFGCGPKRKLSAEEAARMHQEERAATP